MLVHQRVYVPPNMLLFHLIIFISFYTGWLIGIPLMDYDNPKYIGWSLQSSIYQQGCLAATALILVYSYVPHHTISWLNIPISHSAIILLSHYITVYYPIISPTIIHQPLYYCIWSHYNIPISHYITVYSAIYPIISMFFEKNTDCYGFPLVEGPCHPTCRALGRWPATRRDTCDASAKAGGARRRVEIMTPSFCIIHMYIWYMYVCAHIYIYIHIYCIYISLSYHIIMHSPLP